MVTPEVMEVSVSSEDVSLLCCTISPALEVAWQQKPEGMM